MLEVPTCVASSFQRRTQLTQRVIGPRKPSLVANFLIQSQTTLYLGHVTYRGQRFPGKQPAIVSQELWARCQEIRLRNRRGARTFSPRFRTYLFRGMLVCESCGKNMTASTDRVGVPSYRCMSYFKQIPCSALGGEFVNQYLRSRLRRSSLD